MVAQAFPDHGTYARYQKGCKCADCMKAQRDYIRQLRASKNGLREGDPRHGTVNGYANFRCRCKACTAANRLASHCPGCRCSGRAEAAAAIKQALS